MEVPQTIQNYSLCIETHGFGDPSLRNPIWNPENIKKSQAHPNTVNPNDCIARASARKETTPVHCRTHVKHVSFRLIIFDDCARIANMDSMDSYSPKHGVGFACDSAISNVMELWSQMHFCTSLTILHPSTTWVWNHAARLYLTVIWS